MGSDRDSTEGIFKTGKKFSVRGVSIFDGSQEKITREADYWDMATMMEAARRSCHHARQGPRMLLHHNNADGCAPRGFCSPRGPFDKAISTIEGTTCVMLRLSEPV